MQTNITAETTARTSADTAEATARTSADKTLQANIDAEATARSKADTTLQTNITAETTARTSADTTLQANIDKKLSLTGGTMTGDITSKNIIPSANDTYNLGSATKEFLNGYIKYLTVQYLKLGGKDCDIVGLHNGLYRGACLYDAVNGTAGVFSSVANLYTAVHAGNFDDIYIGDYILISISSSYKANETVKMVVAGIDYYLHRGSTELTNHHLVLVPEDCFATTAKMNSSNTTSNGYKGSAMYTTVLPAYATAFSSALGGHLISTTHQISTSVNTSAVNQSGGSHSGASNFWAWNTTNIMLLSEVQAYGSLVWSQGYDIGDANEQLPYFALRPDKLVAHSGYNSSSRISWWLSGVASSTYFCCSHEGGYADVGNASVARGVRPLVLFG